MKAAIGQDSHRFEEGYGKPLILGGVVFSGEVGLLANSDGDVVLHAITNAVSGITGRNILGRVADEMCQSWHHRFSGIPAGSPKITGGEDRPPQHFDGVPAAEDQPDDPRDAGKDR